MKVGSSVASANEADCKGNFINNHNTKKTHHVYSLSHLDVNALGTASATSDAPDGGEDIEEIANLMIEHKGAMDRPGFIG